jgi:DNA-binding transcriptional ArsR family regulator
MSALAVLEAIAEPTRLRILDAVREGERSVTDLVHEVGMRSRACRGTSRCCATPDWSTSVGTRNGASTACAPNH